MWDVLRVLDLARGRLDAAAPPPPSWDEVIAQIRAALAAQGAPPGREDDGAAAPGVGE